jgi:hypothetical protein
VTASVLAWRLPHELSRAQAVSLASGQITVIAGLRPGDVSTDAVMTLDVATGRVIASGRLAEGVHDTAVGVLQGVPYVFAGGNSHEVATVQKVTGVDGTAVGALPQPRSDLEAATVGDQVFLLGGYDGVSTHGEVLATTDGKAFRTVGQLPFPVRYGAAVVVGAKVLLFGGRRGSTTYDTVQQLDPATGQVTVIAHLPKPVSDAVAFTLGGDVFIAGGLLGGNAAEEVWRYDVGTHRTTRLGSLPYRVADPAVAVVDGSAYLIGGEAATDLTTVIRVTTAP